MLPFSPDGLENCFPIPSASASSKNHALDIPLVIDLAVSTLLFDRQNTNQTLLKVHTQCRELTENVF